MAKKILIGIIALIIAIIIIVLLIILIKQPQTPSDKITLKDGITLPQANCAQLGKVTVIHATGCGACAMTIPKLKELEDELNMTFNYYDLTIEQEKQAILDYGLIPEAVPTVIINCKVYVGFRNKEEFRKLILE
ncbi:MAG: hypothetical protein QW625_03735 [Candidatus Nanoarchaeia archaeon]